MTDADWPKRPDGSNKSVGEMTPAERERVMRASVDRLKPEFARMGVRLQHKGDLH